MSGVDGVYGSLTIKTREVLGCDHDELLSNPQKPPEYPWCPPGQTCLNIGKTFPFCAGSKPIFPDYVFGCEVRPKSSGIGYELVCLDSSYSYSNSIFSALKQDLLVTLPCVSPNIVVPDQYSNTLSCIPPQTPSISLNVNFSTSTTIGYGGTVVLTWSVWPATTCLASGDWMGEQGLSGSTTISSIKSNQTYTLTCNGEGVTVTKSATVTVTTSPESFEYYYLDRHNGLPDLPYTMTRQLDGMWKRSFNNINIDNLIEDGRYSVYFGGYIEGVKLRYLNDDGRRFFIPDKGQAQMQFLAQNGNSWVSLGSMLNVQ